MQHRIWRLFQVSGLPSHKLTPIICQWAAAFFYLFIFYVFAQQMYFFIFAPFHSGALWGGKKVPVGVQTVKTDSAAAGLFLTADFKGQQ